ncbi:hypothetical protein [Anaeromicrobium sediminis]|uniref:DUF5673 domain-containing protein n=1 Tax=Anaeromicrobium sediminis TaxID=1478221 RepID=A0A267MGT8_9FIRM|nr:hypothetical protein [Anaeromicrobium sediminis]PAB58095.1 hypothetical protein CCE28_17320 [Anaeromicrobium sediminis]
MYIIKQTIKQKRLSFWKLCLMIIGTIITLDISLRLLKIVSPILATIGALLSFGLAVCACLYIIYRRISYYNYKIIGDELIMERVFGRASHSFLSLKLSELDLFEAYDKADIEKIKEKKAKTYKFISTRETKNWYIGEFTRGGDVYRFVFEPNKELLNAINAVMSY